MKKVFYFALLCVAILTACSPRRVRQNHRYGFLDTKPKSGAQEKVNSVGLAKGSEKVESKDLGQLDSIGSHLPSLKTKTALNGKFQWPLKAVEVTSVYGRRGREFHEGIDLRAPEGTAVFAARGGVVLYADAHIRGYGQLVVIRHENKVATIYAHNSKMFVKRGDQVQQGQQIALSGQTGHATGPHVHFEIRKGISALNPMQFLPPLRATPKKVVAYNSRRKS